MGANNHYPMTGQKLKECAIPKTVTLALDMGRALLAARQEGSEPVAAVATILKGIPLFQGRVTTVEGEDRGGFYITNVGLKGEGPNSGHYAKLVIKNETMALWVDGALRAVFPDLVCMLDPITGQGIMSVEIEEGKPMTLLGVPCHPRLRKTLQMPIGQKAFSGARYGHPELEFAPIEELN